MVQVQKFMGHIQGGRESADPAVSNVLPTADNRSIRHHSNGDVDWNVSSRNQVRNCSHHLDRTTTRETDQSRS
jgi:hypothetical protein